VRTYYNFQKTCVVDIKIYYIKIIAVIEVVRDVNNKDITSFIDLNTSSFCDKKKFPHIFSSVNGFIQ
jgi:hypothetical protein